MNDFFSKKYIFKNQMLMVVSVCLELIDFFRPFLSILMGVQLLCVFLREILPTRPLQPDQLSEKQLVEQITELCYPSHFPHLGFLSRIGPGDVQVQ